MSVSALKWAWRQRPADGSAKLVLLALAQCCNHEHGGDRCYPSHAHLAEMCDMSSRTVQRKLHELRKDGFITWETRKNLGRQSNVYTLPIDDTKTSKKTGGRSDNLSGGRSDNLSGGRSDNLSGGRSDNLSGAIRQSDGGLRQKEATDTTQLCHNPYDIAMSDDKEVKEKNIEKEDACAGAQRAESFSHDQEKKQEAQDHKRKANQPTRNGKPVLLKELVSIAKTERAEGQVHDTDNGSAASSEPDSTEHDATTTASGKTASQTASKPAFVSNPKRREEIAAELAKHGLQVKP